MAYINSWFHRCDRMDWGQLVFCTILNPIFLLLLLARALCPTLIPWSIYWFWSQANKESLQSEPSQKNNSSLAILLVILSNCACLWCSHIWHYLYWSSLHLGECLGTIHVWNVWIPSTEFPPYGNCDCVTCNRLDIHVALLWKLRVVVEDICSWCKWWALSSSIWGPLLGIPHGHCCHRIWHDISSVSILACISLLNDGRVYCMHVWILIFRGNLLRSQVWLRYKATIAKLLEISEILQTAQSIFW